MRGKKLKKFKHSKFETLGLVHDCYRQTFKNSNIRFSFSWGLGIQEATETTLTMILERADEVFFQTLFFKYFDFQTPLFADVVSSHLNDLDPDINTTAGQVPVPSTQYKMTRKFWS